MSEKNWCCIVETSKGYGLLASETDGEWAIRGFASEYEAMNYWESSYQRAHLRSYEASMSACISFITFHPSVVHMSIEELQAMIPKQRVVRIGNISGHVDVIPLDRALGKAAWETGRKPELIKEQPQWTHGRG